MHVGDQSLKYERDIITSLTHIFWTLTFSIQNIKNTQS